MKDERRFEKLCAVGTKTVCLAVVMPVGMYVIWLLCRAVLLDQFVIPTNSMCPTLQPGDHAIVDKSIAGARIYKDLHFDPKGITLQSWRTRGRRPIRHNDVLVFNYPHHDGHINFVINNVYCKRCIALPGDSISAVDGVYSNNNYRGVLGEEENQRVFSDTPDSLIASCVLNTIPFNDHVPWTTKNFGPLYVPRKGDVIDMTPREAACYQILLEWETGKHITWDWESGEVLADGKPYVRHIFTHDYYYMAGDNVMDSNDSRYWGPVPEEYIVGVVTYITYSVKDKNRRMVKVGG